MIVIVYAHLRGGRTVKVLPYGLKWHIVRDE